MDHFCLLLLCLAADEENEEDGTGSDSGGTTRTDLHCEPISNVVLQTAG